MAFLGRRLVGIAVVIGTAAGVAGCGQSPRQPDASPGPTTTVTASPTVVPDEGFPRPSGHPGPTTVVKGVPMGYRRDRAGAMAAAVNFARLNEALVLMGDADAVAARRAMASESAADALAQRIVAELGAFRDAWPVGELTYRVAPLAVRADVAGPEAVGVDVWFVGVVAGRNLVPYEEWITETYRLVWERDDWRVAALSESSGPRPDPGHQKPASAAELDALLVGFEPVP
jgi:hypothetical protein